MMVNMVNNLVGGFNLTPLKNDGVSSSVGMMTFHSQYINYGKTTSSKIPNHQPGIAILYYYICIS